MRHVVAIWLGVLLSLPTVGLAKEKIVLSICEWPPYVMLENGRVSGSDTEIIREAFERLGMASEIRISSWKKALRDVGRGDIHGTFTVYHTPERAEYMYLASEPTDVVRSALVARKESGMNISGLGDLKGKIVGVIGGYSYGKTFDSHPGLKKQTCYDEKEMAILLDKGRIDVGAVDELPFMFISGRMGLGDRFEAIHTLAENPSYVGFSKKALGEKGKALAEKFSETLRQMKKEGCVRKIYEKYR